MLPATKANMVFDPAQLNSSDQVIHLVVPLSVSSGTADKVFVFMLDADAICSALRLDRYGEESWVAVLDSSGQLMAAEQLSDGKLVPLETISGLPEGTRIEYTSERSGCTIVMGISDGFFQKVLFPVSIIMWLIVAVLFVMVVVIAAMLAYRQSKPLTHMVETAEAISQSRAQNPFSYIVNVLEELDTQRRQSIEEVRMANRTLRDVLLGRLLDGKYTLLESGKGAAMC